MTHRYSLAFLTVFDLGPVEAGARLLQLGQLQLRRDIARDLGGGP